MIGHDCRPTHTASQGRLFLADERAGPATPLGSLDLVEARSPAFFTAGESHYDRPSLSLSHLLVHAATIV